MAKKATIRDVAAEAKVSLGTIHRVLYDKGKVSDEKKRAVLEAVEKMNYNPSRVAQTLALQKNIKIGVVYPDVEANFWAEIKNGIQKAAREFSPFGLEVISKPTQTYDLDEQIAAINFLREQKINGISLMPVHNSRLNEVINQLAEENIPVASFVSDAPRSKRICFVGQSSIRSGILAGELMGMFLKGQGKVAVLRAQRDVLVIQQRITGFVEKIETEYPDIEIAGFYDMYEVNDAVEKVYDEKAYNLTCQIIEEMPDVTGIFISNALTNWIGRAIKAMNKQGQIKVVGYDYSEEISNQLREGAIQAVICQDPFSEGYYPIRYLYDLIVKNKYPEKEIINTKLEILIKENLP